MREDEIVFRLTRKGMRRLVAVLAVIGVILVMNYVVAQKLQDTYDDKFKVATEDGGTAIATSADGKYVYVTGSKGVLVSDDFGKTGSWVQTVRLKK